MANMPCFYPAGTYTEWLVTGDAGPGFPAYRHVFTDEDQLRQFLDPERAFLRNVANVVVSRRAVIVEEWLPASDALLGRMGIRTGRL